MKLFISDTNINAAKISLYSLEESRISFQNPEESNFHVFYVIFQHLPNNLKIKFHLNALSTFTYLNGYKPTNDLEFQTFTSLDIALTSFGYSAESKNTIYAWLAAILHLGEIQFDENENGYVTGISESTKMYLNYVADLLNIEADQLMKAILQHKINSTNEVYAYTLIVIVFR